MKHAMIPLLILFCAADAQIAPAQPTPVKTASSNQTEQNPKLEGAITGRVIGADGQPMSDVRVYGRRISESPRSHYSVASDDDGNFKLTGLSAGAYILNAYVPGYVTAESLYENAIHRIGENVSINMIKGGVITGRVTDEAGEPLVGVNVLSYRLRNLEGITAGFESYSRNEGMTDDRGIYRIYGLPPGVYIVRISSEYSFNLAQIIGDAPTYYPSATRDTASEINLRGGEEVSGIDIRHRGDRGRIVSGAISREIESSPARHNFSIRLKGLETGRFEAETYVSSSLGFAFYGVPDGDYELIARRTSDGGDASSSARRRISVKGMDVSGIELKLAPHGSIAGRVVIESSNPPKRCPIEGGLAENREQS
jgi:Carboxypeptidase regulatory-like domain